MFYYISFLRPPPSVAPLSSRTIPVTPQVANDLRTQLFPADIDLYYAWSKAKLPPDDFEPSPKPSKLTTWRAANAYKEIAIPLPHVVREGDSWRLLLTASDGLLGVEADRLHLGDPALGILPFPVFSMPIHFSNKMSASSPFSKQDSIRRIMALNRTRDPDASGEPSVVIAEQTSYDLDKKIWDSGVGLSAWLVGLLRSEGSTADEAMRRLRDLLLCRRSVTAVELGAGTGIVSLIVAALRARHRLPRPETASEEPHPRASDCIISTDLESAMPILRHNVASNSHVLRKDTPEPSVLDWDVEQLPSNVLNARSEGIDLLILADVTYNTSAFPSLVRTLEALVAGGTRPPLVLLGYKERDPDERTLWNLVQAIGLRLVKHAEVRGAGGDPVEIWLGSFTLHK